MNEQKIAWYRGYVACVLGDVVNPYDYQGTFSSEQSDSLAQSWEDGFNAAFRETYGIVA